MKEVRCLRKLLLIIALVLVPLIEIHADELNQSGFPLKNSPIVCDSLKQANDTIPTEIKDTLKIDKISDSRFGRIVSYTAPLFVAGMVVGGQDAHFRSLRNTYLPQFHDHLDDYLQYSPAAVLVGMKALGVKGRSSWTRMFLSDAFSVAIMAGLVNSLKMSAQVERPDGSNKRSFPSGHTATAFMTATMLTKEYGHRSPWIGIGAYSVAIATGAMRMANNKHWLSDVITGAGIGILSTELGYYIGDLIFKNRGLYYKRTAETFEKMSKPSFLSLSLAVGIPLSSYDIEGVKLKTSSDCMVGIEGAYFLNPYFGVGGRTSLSRMRIIVNDVKTEDNSVDALKLGIGAYFSYPLSNRWLVGSRLLPEFVHYRPNLKSIETSTHSRIGIGTGLSLTYKASKSYAVRVLFDYDLLPPNSKKSGEYMHFLAIGTSYLISF